MGRCSGDGAPRERLAGINGALFSSDGEEWPALGEGEALVGEGRERVEGVGRKRNEEGRGVLFIGGEGELIHACAGLKVERGARGGAWLKACAGLKMTMRHVRRDDLTLMGGFSCGS